MTPEEAAKKYGPIVDGVWLNEKNHCSLLPLPSGDWSQWMNVATKGPVVHIYCLNDMQRGLYRALCNVIDRYRLEELKTFDGCFSIRDIRGVPGQLSAHSYAGAIDINASTNLLGTRGDISIGLVKCFTDEGFTWGGRFQRQDPMHFSWLGF